MSGDGHTDEAVRHRGSRTHLRQPTTIEGRVADRSNPAPLNRLSPGAVVTAQVLALGPALIAGALLTRYGLPFWVIPGVVAVAALSLTVRWRELSPVERLLRRRAPSATERVPLSVELPEGTSMGVIRDGRLLTSVLEVRPDAPTLVVDGARPDTTLPLDLLADHLSRYDVDLHSIDITVAPAGDGRGDRTAWITLRFDPALDLEAVDRRGGHDDGAVRTLVTVTRRLALRLGGEGLSVTPLDVAGISRAAAHFAGSGRQASPAGPADTAGNAATAHPAGTADTVAGVLHRRALATGHEGATWISLRGRDRAGRLHWCAAVTVPPGADAPEGTSVLEVRAGGEPSVLAPGEPGIGPDSALRPHLDTVADLAVLSPVLDRPGPLLGVDADGRAVRLGMPGRAQHLALSASTDTARRIVVRALRAGIAVEVITADTDAWESLHGAGARLVVRHLDDRGGPGWTPGLVVVDTSTHTGTDGEGAATGEHLTAHTAGVPVLTVIPPGARAPRPAVRLTENGGDAAGSLTVTGDGRRLHVGLVELPGEAQFV